MEPSRAYQKTGATGPLIFLEKVRFFGKLKYTVLHFPIEIIGKCVLGVLRSLRIEEDPREFCAVGYGYLLFSSGWSLSKATTTKKTGLWPREWEFLDMEKFTSILCLFVCKWLACLLARTTTPSTAPCAETGGRGARRLPATVL